MANLFSAGTNALHRPRLYRSDHQPNLLEYIDSTLNESFSLNLTLTRTISYGYDQFGNTILDQYLLYLLCQKISPNRTDYLTKDFYQLLHQLILFNGRISKGFFEYSPSTTSRAIFHSYANFMWNEFDLNVLLEIGCFLLKYRLKDIFRFSEQKILGYFLEILAIYYLSSNHPEFFRNSRSDGMIFPSPSLYLFSSSSSSLKMDEELTFKKFLQALYDNGEIHFDLHQMKNLLQTEAYQFVNTKLENQKIGLSNFLEKTICSLQQNSCRSLKSICRLVIKMNLRHYPNDIQQLILIFSNNVRLQKFLIYENPFAFQSDI